jgi:hypothetical protein
LNGMYFKIRHRKENLFTEPTGVKFSFLDFNLYSFLLLCILTKVETFPTKIFFTH